MGTMLMQQVAGGGGWLTDRPITTTRQDNSMGVMGGLTGNLPKVEWNAVLNRPSCR